MRAAVMLLMALIVGCGQGDKPKTADLGLLKTQREALEQAKQVEQVVQDAAEQQHRVIEQGTQ